MKRDVNALVDTMMEINAIDPNEYGLLVVRVSLGMPSKRFRRRETHWDAEF